MLFSDILFEADKSLVDSSWIVQLKYGYPWNLQIAYMKTNTGAVYKISGIPMSVFKQWKSANSIGNFFHTHIKRNYLITR